MTWQTLDSAPMDGTDVDLWCLDPRVTEARYMGGLGRPVLRRNRGRRFVEYYWCDTHKCWRSRKNSHFIDSPDRYGGYIPMFWMPVPAEPEFIGTNRTLAEAAA
jgi:hypothetical protein